MSREQLATTTGGVVMFTAALLAAAAVRLVATDPLGVASLAAADDVATLLGRVASRIAGWF